MTGYRSRFFRHQCDGGQHCYYEQLPEWDDLIEECFPRQIRPTDIDGMVEINDHFLFLEQKHCGAGPNEGQRRALRRLSKRSDVTVVFFRPESDGQTEQLQVLIFDRSQSTGWQSRSREWLKDWLRAWCAAAERGPTTADEMRDLEVA